MFQKARYLPTSKKPGVETWVEVGPPQYYKTREINSKREVKPELRYKTYWTTGYSKERKEHKRVYTRASVLELLPIFAENVDLEPYPYRHLCG